MIYARGSSDDKGQMFIHIKALESYLATEGKAPVNVKFMIEGEEEIGSFHLARLHPRQRRALQGGCLRDLGYGDARHRPARRSPTRCAA